MAGEAILLTETVWQTVSVNNMASNCVTARARLQEGNIINTDNDKTQGRILMHEIVSNPLNFLSLC